MSILVLTSDTLIGTPAAGNIEYSSPIFAATPIGTQRGIVPTQQYFRLNAAYVGTNVNTAQSLFGVGVTLSASTVYEFEMFYIIQNTAGSLTQHQMWFGYGGTATLNNFAVTGTGYIDTNTGATGVSTAVAESWYATATTLFSVTGNITTGVTGRFIVKGSVSVNAGGTFIPQYLCSTAPGTAYSTLAGSFVKINPLSASGANTSVGTWA